MTQHHPAAADQNEHTPRQHVLTLAEFDTLATGAGRAHGALRGGQLSKRVLLLRLVVDTGAERGAPLQAVLRGALTLLSAAQRRDRAATETVLLSPPVGAWATHCLRRLRGLTVAPTPIEDDLAYLVGLAAGAAIRARLDFEVTLRATAHGLMLPTFGMAMVPRDAGPLRARHRAGSGSVELDGVGTIPVLQTDGPDTRLWRPLRRLTSTVGDQRISVVLDDLDPYRDHQGLPVAGRLSSSEAAAWQARLHEAWTILARDHRMRAEAIAHGVMAFVPLQATESAPELSASSTDTFGAVALTYPTDGLTMAGALVHEFQHAKLSALLDLVPLHGRSSGQLFYAPWRSDPRPLRGLLQGAYAYLGLCDFWQVHRAAPTENGAPLAQFEFARWREQVWRALPALETSGDLTAEGTRFVSGMRNRAAVLRQAEVPDRPAAFARLASADHQMTWRLRNMRPEPEIVAQRADAWLAGRSCPAPRAAPSRLVPGEAAFHMTGRIRLARMGALDPGRFDRLRDDPARLAALVPPATVADARYVSGDVRGALQAYREEITRDPNRINSWTGLALARRDLAGQGEADPLDALPEETFALTVEIARRSGAAPDPLRLAAWLAAEGAGTVD